MLEKIRRFAAKIGKKRERGIERADVMREIGRSDGAAEKRPLIRSAPDAVFTVLVIVLVLVGTVMSFSASTAYAQRETGDSFYYLKQHIGHLIIGAVPVLLCVFLLTPRRAKLLSAIIYGVSLLLLAAVLVVGAADGVAKRWINLGFFTFQPSELAKTGIVLLMALYMSQKENEINRRGFNKNSAIHGFLVPGCIFGAVCLLVMLENHFSGVIIIGMIGIAMMFMGGTQLRYFLSVVPVGGALLAIILQTPYAKSRIDSWINRGADALGSDWQSTQGLYAIGTGGLFGLGIGNSQLKHGYVSQPQNDFVFTVVCEELGFFGAAAILVLFLALAVRGFILASRAPDKFSSLVIFGLTFKTALHVLINVAVVTGLFPNTGISLPFFSSGGSATLMQLFDMGVILGLSRFSTQKR